MATRTATSPDGRQWDVVVRRVMLPQWPRWNYEPSNDADGDIVWSIFIYVVVAPVMWIVVPLLTVIAQLPVGVLRPVFSPVRWVEAECESPSTITMLWRTTRDRVGAVADEIAQRLPNGYDNLTPDGAEFVSMTEPPGLRDLDS